MVKPTGRSYLLCFACCIALVFANIFFLACVEMPRAPSLPVYRYPPSDLREEAAWSDDPRCLGPALPYGQLEVVVGAGLCSKPGAWDKIHGWVGLLGLPRVIVHIYWREQGCDALYSHVQLPCGMQYEHHVLLPNKGNEAASYAEYIRTRYDSLPRSVAFVHEHGPQKVWHSHCELFYGRMTAYYRGLGEWNDPSSRYGRFARGPMVSLSGGCSPCESAPLQGTNGLDSAWTEIISNKAVCSLSHGAPRMNWTEGLWRMWQDAGYSGSADEEEEEETMEPEAWHLAIMESLKSMVGQPPPEARPTNKETPSYNRCNAALSRVEQCPYQDGCNDKEGPGRFWSCCNSYIARAEALRLQPRRLFDVFLSQCAFPEGQMSSASGRVMEYRAYAWFNGSESSPEAMSDLIWATKGQRQEVLKRGCEIDAIDAPVDNLMGFKELMPRLF